jgi:hypothetical protein
LSCVDVSAVSVGRVGKLTISIVQHMSILPMAAQIEVKSSTLVGTVGAITGRVSARSYGANQDSRLRIITYGLHSQDRQHREHRRRSS